MRERHSNSAEGDDSTDMADNVANTDRKQCANGLLRDDRLLTKTEPPDREDVEHTDKELCPRDEPGDWKPVEHLLVRNVVYNVECIPEEDVKAHSQGRGLLPDGRGSWGNGGGGRSTRCGSVRCGENDAVAARGIERTSDRAEMRATRLVEMTDRSGRAERGDDGGDKGEESHDVEDAFLLGWMDWGGGGGGEDGGWSRTREQ